MWTTATADEKLRLVFLPMGNSSVDYGSNRSEADQSTSLVAIDVTTGEPAWSSQTVNRHFWDYDVGNQARRSARPMSST